MSESDARDRIAIYSDYVCPFCYLGRASLSRYRDDRDEELAIDWHPFDLRAGKRAADGEIDRDVDDGKDDEYFERALENVRRLRERYDVEMRTEDARDVDSLPAQVASYHVQATAPYEDWLAFDVAIFDALWKEGRDIGDADVLAALAADVGLDPATIRDAIEDPEIRAAVRKRFDDARRRGISGVPTFVSGEHVARGAVPPEQLERLVEGA